MSNVRVQLNYPKTADNVYGFDIDDPLLYFDNFKSWIKEKYSDEYEVLSQKVDEQVIETSKYTDHTYSLYDEQQNECGYSFEAPADIVVTTDDLLFIRMQEFTKDPSIWHAPGNWTIVPVV